MLQPNRVRQIFFFLCFAGITAIPLPAQALFHFYDVREIYSSADGSVQFVELFTTFDNQQFLNNHTIVASQGGSTRTFTFVGTGPSPTGNAALLIATASFEEACGITPDYILPDNFLFSPDGTVNFGENSNIVSYLTLPLDDETSLHFPGTSEALNSPENFAGETCSLAAAIEVPSISPLGIGILGALMALSGSVYYRSQKQG